MMKIPLSELILLPDLFTLFLNEIRSFYTYQSENQGDDWDVQVDHIAHFQKQIFTLKKIYQLSKLPNDQLSEIHLLKLSELLYQQTLSFISHFKNLFKEQVNAIFYQKIRWCPDPLIEKHYHQYKNQYDQIAIRLNLNASLKPNLNDFLQNKQRYLKRVWFFCAKPVWMTLLDLLKRNLFELFPHPTMKWAIAYALYEEASDCFKDPHQVENQSLIDASWTGISRLLSQSQTLPYYPMIIQIYKQMLADDQEDFEIFSQAIVQNLFQRELLTQHQNHPKTQIAIQTLVFINHPILISLILNKINAQKPSELQMTLCEVLFELLKQDELWLNKAFSYLSPKQRQLLRMIKLPKFGFHVYLEQGDYAKLLSILNHPKEAFLNLYLTLATRSSQTLDLNEDSLQILSLNLIKAKPQQFFKILISLPNDILKSFLNEQHISVLGLAHLKHYLIKLLQSLLTQSHPSVSIKQYDVKENTIIQSLTQAQQVMVNDYIALLDSKLIKRSFRDQRSILLILFDLLEDDLGLAIFNEVMSCYQPSILNARRVRRVFELLIQLKKIGVTFEHTLSFMLQKSHQDIKSLYVDLEFFGRQHLFAWLQLDLLLLNEHEEDHSILDHAFLPTLMALYSSYVESPRLLECLKGMFVSMISGNFKSYKYQAMIENQSYVLSHTQRHFWIKHVLSFDFSKEPFRLIALPDQKHFDYVIRESDDPIEIAEASVFPIETCLSWRSGLNNRSLLSFIVDPHLKLILFSKWENTKKEQSKATLQKVARAFWRLSYLDLYTPKVSKLVLVLEPIYSLKDHLALYACYLWLSLSKAKSMLIPMIVSIKDQAEAHQAASIRQEIAKHFGYSLVRTQCRLSLIGSITGYELSDTLSCFDLPQAIGIEADVFLFIPDWWEKTQYQISEFQK